MFGIGIPELVLILIVGLIVFGPSKLPEVGRAVGKGIREFRKASSALTAAIDAESAPPPQPHPTALPAQNAPVVENAGEVQTQPAATAEQPPAQPVYEPPTQESVRAALEAGKGKQAEGNL